MDAPTFVDLLESILRQADHPSVVGVDRASDPSVRIDCADGSTVYCKVAHVGPARQTPDRPTWPGYPS